MSKLGAQIAKLWICLAIAVTTASCKRSKLKLIKNHLRSTIELERLLNMAILSIEHAFARQIWCEEILINKEFASFKGRKANF